MGVYRYKVIEVVADHPPALIYDWSASFVDTFRERAESDQLNVDWFRVDG